MTGTIEVSGQCRWCSGDHPVLHGPGPCPRIPFRIAYFVDWNCGERDENGVDWMTIVPWQCDHAFAVNDLVLLVCIDDEFPFVAWGWVADVTNGVGRIQVAGEGTERGFLYADKPKAAEQ